MARTVPSSCAAPIASAMAWYIATVIAFFFSGRAIAMRATPLMVCTAMLTSPPDSLSRAIRQCYELRELLERAGRLPADLVLHDGGEAKQPALPPQRLAGPAPQAEAVDLLHDLAGRDDHLGVHPVDDDALGRREGVARGPVDLGPIERVLEDLDVDLEVFRLGEQHLPHHPRALRRQAREHRIAEGRMVRVEQPHG